MSVPLVCSSIDHMSEVMRHAVEAGEKLKEELVLKQDEFLVNEVSQTGQRSNTSWPVTPNIVQHVGLYASNFE